MKTSVTTSVVNDLSGPVRILVVDDEPDIAASLAELLSRSEGYEVTTAANGQAAMAMLEAAASEPARAIDLVLLDVRMPIMSGPEVLAWLREHPELKYTRVIMLTAAAGNEEKVEALSAGADDYITKPYYPLELLARVKTILRTQQLEKQLQVQSQQLFELNQISRAVTSNLATGEVLTTSVEGALKVLDLEAAAAFMVDNEQRYLFCRHMSGQQQAKTSNAFRPIPVGEGIIGLSFLRGKGIRLNDPAADRRFRPNLDAPSGVSVRSILALPLIVRGKAVGVLVALNKKAGCFSEVDQGMFTSLASSASRALEITWLIQHLRQRQQELLESRNMLQAAIDGILLPIYTIDSSWQLVAVNRSKVEEMGLETENLVGQTCFQTFFGRTSPCLHCNASSTLSEKVAQNWSVRWLGKDHLPLEWEVNAYPMPGSLAGSAQAVVVWQDRTEERRLESSLLQAGKLAAIGQLAAGVAHEINNPLTAINANAQMLQMAIKPEDANYESVELIARAGDRAAKVVRGLLDFARQTQYEFETADVNASIGQALNLVSYQLTLAHIEVIKDFAQNLPEIDASWQHLQSVWLNMIINARDVLNEKVDDRRIEIITRPDRDGERILVIIRDNGQGMTPAQVSHIFEPFYTTKAPGQGTGLGLATCQQIVKQHGGVIEVASEPGKGTTFFVRLPINHR